MSQALTHIHRQSVAFRDLGEGTLEVKVTPNTMLIARASSQRDECFSSKPKHSEVATMNRAVPAGVTGSPNRSGEFSTSMIEATKEAPTIARQDRLPTSTIALKREEGERRDRDAVRSLLENVRVTEYEASLKRPSVSLKAPGEERELVSNSITIPEAFSSSSGRNSLSREADAYAQEERIKALIGDASPASLAACYAASLYKEHCWHRDFRERWAFVLAISEDAFDGIMMHAYTCLYQNERNTPRKVIRFVHLALQREINNVYAVEFDHCEKVVKDRRSARRSLSRTKNASSSIVK